MCNYGDNFTILQNLFLWSLFDMSRYFIGNILTSEVKSLCGDKEEEKLTEREDEVQVHNVKEIRVKPKKVFV